MSVTNPQLAETAVFAAGSGRCDIQTQAPSPRAAFQAALHGRASILDLRTGAERAREGELPAYLSAGGDDGHREVIALAGDDGLTLGLPAIVGGFTGWLTAGMPVSRLPLAT
jgi:rhodanese-related sulfurtransferase